MTTISDDMDVDSSSDEDYEDFDPTYDPVAEEAEKEEADEFREIDEVNEQVLYYQIQDSRPFTERTLPYVLEDKKYSKNLNTLHARTFDVMPQHGPKDKLTKPRREWTVADTTNLFMENIYKEILNCSKIYINEHHSKKQKKNISTFSLTMDSLTDTFLVHDAMGILRYPNRKDYWREDDICNGLFGNDFIKSVMSHREFETINRVIHCDVYKICEMMNDKRKELWHPYPTINCDDDQQPWKGRGGKKQKNDRKAHGIGIVMYKAVDASLFCLAAYFPTDPKIIPPMGKSLLTLFDSVLPQENPYLMCADAGPLGSVPHAQFLAEKGRNVLMSFTAKRDGIEKYNTLAKFLDMGLELHQYQALYTDKVGVLSWWAKGTGKKKKIVRFVFTDPEMVRPTEVERYNKVTQSNEMVPAPNSTAKYNGIKYFIDEKRAIISAVQYIFRARRPFRAMLEDLINTYTHDMYIWHKHAVMLSDDYTFKHFLIDRIKLVHHHRHVPAIVPTASVTYHELVPHPHQMTRGHCVVCKTARVRRYCSICSTSSNTVWLCEGLCAIRFHNPRIVVNTGK